MPVGRYAPRLVVERHRDGLEDQFAATVAIAFLHQFAAIESTVVGHEIEVVRSADKPERPLHRPCHADRIPQTRRKDSLATGHETVYRRKPHAAMDSLKGKGASALAMENRHVVNLHSAHALRHIGDVVALHLGAEQQVALSQAA